MIANNEERYIRISLLLRAAMRYSRDAYECLHKNDEFELVHLIDDLTRSIKCINIELNEASCEEYEAYIKKMFEEERENGGE